MVGFLGSMGSVRATSFLDFTGLVVSPVALVSVGLVVFSGSVRAVSFVELIFR